MERIKERTRKSLGSKIGSNNLTMMKVMAMKATMATMAKIARRKRKGESHVSPLCHLNEIGINNRVLTSST